MELISDSARSQNNGMIPNDHKLVLEISGPTLAYPKHVDLCLLQQFAGSTRLADSHLSLPARIANALAFLASPPRASAWFHATFLDSWSPISSWTQVRVHRHPPEHRVRIRALRPGPRPRAPSRVQRGSPGRQTRLAKLEVGSEPVTSLLKPAPETNLISRCPEGPPGIVRGTETVAASRCKFICFRRERRDQVCCLHRVAHLTSRTAHTHPFRTHARFHDFDVVSTFQSSEFEFIATLQSTDRPSSNPCTATRPPSPGPVPGPAGIPWSSNTAGQARSRDI